MAHFYAKGIRIVGWLFLAGAALVAVGMIIASSSQSSVGYYASALGLPYIFSFVGAGVFLVAIGQLIAAVLDSATHTAMIVLLLQNRD